MLSVVGHRLCLCLRKIALVGVTVSVSISSSEAHNFSEIMNILLGVWIISYIPNFCCIVSKLKWRKVKNVLCRCPPGHMIRVNGTKKSCVYTLCATRPCHRGTCVAQSPSKFTCHCPEGYRGRHCETTLAVYREDVGLSFSSLFAICICFMALLGRWSTSCDVYRH